jgi:RimJ/RimL family protein N-acetyltransferase
VPLLQQLDADPETTIRWRWRGMTPDPGRWARSTFDGTLAQFLVVARKDDEPVGVIALYEANFQDKYATFAAARFDNTRRSTAMILGLAIFLRYTFACWDLRKLYMELPEYNYAQFASGAGRLFELEGRLRDHYWYDGRLWDQLVLAIHRDTWLGSSRPLLDAEAAG